MKTLPTEEAVAKAFEIVSRIGERYEIPLPGDDSVVPFRGPTGEADFRVSDVEAVLHELAHCVVADIPITETLVRDIPATLDTYGSDLSRWVDELQSISITHEVMRMLGIAVETSDAADDINEQASRLKEVEFSDIAENELVYIDEFIQTPGGRLAVWKLAKIIGIPCAEPTVESELQIALEQNSARCLDDTADREFLYHEILSAIRPFVRSAQ
jgi:hypothetical protein